MKSKKELLGRWAESCRWEHTKSKYPEKRLTSEKWRKPDTSSLTKEEKDRGGLKIRDKKLCQTARGKVKKLVALGTRRMGEINTSAPWQQ